MIFSPLAVFAGEVDHHSTQQIPLEESASWVNEFIRDQIEKSVGLSNYDLSRTDRAYAPHEILRIFHRHFENLIAGKYQGAIGSIESCLMDLKCSEGVDVIRLPGKRSIYHNLPSFKYSESELSPIIKVCGVRLGADKITHFLNDGIKHYKAYLKNQRSEDYVINLSEFLEASPLGLKFTGVFSRADIEANWQGFNYFLTGMKEELSVYTTTVEGSRRLHFHREQFDICNYITKEMSEFGHSSVNSYMSCQDQKPCDREVLENRIRERDRKYEAQVLPMDEAKRLKEKWNEEFFEELNLFRRKALGERIQMAKLRSINSPVATQIASIIESYPPMLRFRLRQVVELILKMSPKGIYILYQYLFSEFEEGDFEGLSFPDIPLETHVLFPMKEKWVSERGLENWCHIVSAKYDPQCNDL
tara:strand:- start:28798 stop:30048 length:1251 start_codon:yes stop_codon:yes gene_type:complete